MDRAIDEKRAAKAAKEEKKIKKQHRKEKKRAGRTASISVPAATTPDPSAVVGLPATSPPGPADIERRDDVLEGMASVQPDVSETPPAVLKRKGKQLVSGPSTRTKVQTPPVVTDIREDEIREEISGSQGTEKRVPDLSDRYVPQWNLRWGDVGSDDHQIAKKFILNAPLPLDREESSRLVDEAAASHFALSCYQNFVASSDMLRRFKMNCNQFSDWQSAKEGYEAEIESLEAGLKEAQEDAKILHDNLDLTTKMANEAHARHSATILTLHENLQTESSRRQVAENDLSHTKVVLSEKETQLETQKEEISELKNMLRAKDLALKDSSDQAVKEFMQSEAFKKQLDRYAVDWMMDTIDHCRRLCMQKLILESFDFLDERKIATAIEARRAIEPKSEPSDDSETDSNDEEDDPSSSTPAN